MCADAHPYSRCISTTALNNCFTPNLNFSLLIKTGLFHRGLVDFIIVFFFSDPCVFFLIPLKPDEKGVTPATCIIGK